LCSRCQYADGEPSGQNLAGGIFLGFSGDVSVDTATTFSLGAAGSGGSSPAGGGFSGLAGVSKETYPP
jgi:hypothetical protein